jgi:hypothetical protein
MGKMNVALRQGSLPAGISPDKSNPGLNHGVPPAKQVHAGD